MQAFIIPSHCGSTRCSSAYAPLLQPLLLLWLLLLEFAVYTTHACKFIEGPEALPCQFPSWREDNQPAEGVTGSLNRQGNACWGQLTHEMLSQACKMLGQYRAK